MPRRQIQLLLLFVLVLTWSWGTSAFAEPTKTSGSRLVRTFEKLHEEATEKKKSDADEAVSSQGTKKTLEQATFGNGCFWCTEAVFEELKGVTRVVSGYSGGRIPNPTYRQVSTGLTGHAEVIHLQYDPDVISFAKLLEVFWRTHDPTTKNQQGPDIGPQYRSAVFYHTDEQRDLAKRFKVKLNEAHAFRKPIVTEITKFKSFYPAEKYHQNYFALNGRAPYCQRIVRPKLTKFRRVFSEELKRNKDSK